MKTILTKNQAYSNLHPYLDLLKNNSWHVDFWINKLK